MSDVNRLVQAAALGSLHNVKALGLDLAPGATALSALTPVKTGLAFGIGARLPVFASLPPPMTNPGKVPLVRVKTAVCEIELDFEVLADGKDPKLGRRAETRPDVTGISTMFPGLGVDGAGVVVQIDTPLILKGTIKVQTFYGPQASPSAPSEYGRGTTKDDERLGNTSVGFHEACHRNDVVAYLNTKTLPRFGGKVGLTLDQFRAAQKQYSADLQTYFDGIEAFSRQNTDEVGYTRTEYERKGPRKP